ncbi:tandem-95 repeat protein [Rhodopirellula halodulae]|uniref:tandem-95 repeat protein n=1 Tax=Rhodopirellula halodulae TaxID=2894198 RepID=UPI001E30560A|nr:Ig-like domain-containing protein [Rhodopirellula sp. JC737]MCC9658214.1 Ig-like domain-containing protein [Rhodopirellula sp. JC737]
MTLRRFHSLLGNAATDTSSAMEGTENGQRATKNRRLRNDRLSRRSKWQTADRRLRHESLEKRELLAAEVLAIRPDAGALISDGDTLRNTPRELNLLFNGNANLVESTIDGNVRLVRAGGDGTFGDGNEVEVSLGYLGLETPGDTSLEGRQRIVMRPASNAIHNATDPSASLPDDIYRIEITASLESEEASGNVAFNGGVDFASTFTLDRAAQVVAVVPQPVERNSDGSLTHLRDRIDVYFDDQRLDLNDAENEDFYRLINANDGSFSANPIDATYYPNQNRVELAFAPGVLSNGNFRLDVGTSEDTPILQTAFTASNDLNSSMDTATQIDNLSGNIAKGIYRVSGEIEPQFLVPQPRYPGGLDYPSHRNVQVQNHYKPNSPAAGNLQPPFPQFPPLPNLLTSAIGTQEEAPNVFSEKVVTYSFPSQFPANAIGDIYQNLITPEQKEITRGILEIYAQQLGYEFIEQDTGGALTIGRGDLRAADPDEVSEVDGTAGLANSRQIVLDFEDFDNISTFGDGFTGTMFHEVGHALGLGHTYEEHTTMGIAPISDTQPGEADLVYLQRVAPPVSTDVDVYRFNLDSPGRVQIETFAERLSTPSLLNTHLRLFKRDPLHPDRSTEIAGNYSFFGSDSYVDVELEAGEYFVGVSSAGNDQYNPASPDSGFGGSTFGEYGLQLTFEPSLVAGQQLRDVSGTPIDGDADGQSGGTYSFWFQATDTPDTIFVDKLSAAGGDGSLATPYDTIDAALADAENRDDEVVVEDLSATNFAELTGQTLSVAIAGVTLTFTFGTSGTNPINLATATDAADAASIIAGRINTVAGTTIASSAGGTLSVAAENTLSLDNAPSLEMAPKVIRIVGNAVDSGVSGTFATDDPLVNDLGELTPYLVGVDPNANVLEDGAQFRVPRNTTVMIDAGVLLKMRAANIDIGTVASTDTNRSGGAIQLLGTPTIPVYLRSYHDDTAGGESDGNDAFAPTSGDFGGIVIRDDSDLESRGIFLNSINYADIKQGGGKVFVNSVESNFAPIHILNARPTVTFSTITESADVAMLATPDSFEDSLNRIGPDISGNYLQDNGSNGLLVFIQTDGSGRVLDKMTVSGRFDDTDIPHIINESLIIQGNPGGPEIIAGVLHARPSGRLVIDPGMIIKLDGSRIEAERGQSNLIAEGTENEPIIFTSVLDDRFGGSGAFDLNRNPGSTGSPGDWAGIIFSEASSGSIDHALISYGGGDAEVPGVSGGLSNFNVIEVHQALVRIANSSITLNADGHPIDLVDDPQDPTDDANVIRAGIGANSPATIYVRGAQPAIIGNEITDNAGPAISINVNALRHEYFADPGRQTGLNDQFKEFDDNRGPLIRINELENNAVNGLDIRNNTTPIDRFDGSGFDDPDFNAASVLNDSNITTEIIWDDTDIVHVVNGELSSGNLSTYGGIRMLSSVSESLVVKVNGADSGFTATGSPLDINDRIGGTIHVIGQPGYPVIITDINDDTVGAGYTPSGDIVFDTGNNGQSNGTSGSWRGFVFDEFSNDRNVALIGELEPALTSGNELNDRPSGNRAQDLGTLAPDMKSGDENRRLGFEVMGYISPDAPDDVDVYSFGATGGTEVWIDLDRTGSSLNGVVELIDNLGNVLAASSDPNVFTSGSVAANPLTKNFNLGGDTYTLNHKDPGMRIELPGTGAGQYFVRVRSLEGVTAGGYRLQIRMQQIDEFPGSTVRFADIRYATTAIDVQGLPSNSFLTGDAAEAGDAAAEFGGGQALINLLRSDSVALSIAGEIGNAADVDVYEVDLTHMGQPSPEASTIALVFDIDYADQVSGLDSTIAVFNSNNELIYIGRESNIDDDRPDPSAADGRGLDDLSRGTVGDRDPYIGPVNLTPGSVYYVAVMSDQMVPTSAAVQFYTANPNGGPDARLTRLEPVNSVQRIVEDHIGFSGYTSNADDRDTPINEEVRILPTTPAIFNIDSTVELETHIGELALSDVPLFMITDRVTQLSNGSDDNFYLADPFNGGNAYRNYFPANNTNLNAGDNDIQDIVIRSDGRMFGYARLDGNDGSVGTLVEIDPNTGAIIASQNDGILGVGPTPNTSTIDDDAGSHGARAQEFMDSDDVDALTFERVGSTNNVPDYLTYYSVRETATRGTGTSATHFTTSRLYLGRENGDASPRTSANGPDYGFQGEIQPAGVTTSTSTFSFVNAADPAQRTDILVRSKLPGENGNIVINLQRVVDGTTEITSFSNNMHNGSASVINIELDIVGTPATGGPSAQQIVDLINNHDDVSQMVIAVIAGGNGANSDGANGTQAVANTTPINTPGVGTPMGRVTGLSFSSRFGSSDLYGVTENGEFISINESTGEATILYQDSSVSFAGLALGPENVEDSRYRRMLFATTTSGELFAFDPEDTLGRGTADVGGFEAKNTPAPIFAGNANSISITRDVNGNTQSLSGSAVGVAFSPSDFNLWHPTMRRGSDAGHGVNQAPDGSRSGNTTRHAIPGDLATGDDDPTEANGGASWYFGLETWDSTPANGSNKYLNPAGDNNQFGITQVQHADLSSNPLLNNSYDLPGGARGLLDSGTFDLSGVSSEDRPTLYFNYFLETQNSAGVDSDEDPTFRDSARVYARSDQSNGWELVATNNSTLTDDGDYDAELPEHLSHLSNPHDSSSVNPAAQTRRTVQELHENSNLWRQARIDLSTFAGDTNVQLRFGFSTTGNSLDDLEGDEYGIYDEPDSTLARDNNREGFYVDDIIVGFAERGEMVTAAPSNSAANAFTNLAANPRTNLDATELARRPQLNGEYQLEIRRTDYGEGFLYGLSGNEANVIERNDIIYLNGVGGGDYADAFGDNGSIVILDTFDTNARHTMESGGTLLLADQNRERSQGVFLLESNIIRDSSVVGVHVQPGRTEGDGNGVTYPGALKNFEIEDSTSLVPGVVILNNVIVGGNGIQFDGPNSTDPQQPLPYGRIINNTIVGDGSGTGLTVSSNASPIVLNNIFADLGVGIVTNNEDSGTEIENNLFHGNGDDGTQGTNFIISATTLFAAGTPAQAILESNFYLAAGSVALDDSEDANERSLHSQFKALLGIPPSPVLTPDRDALGQVRANSGGTTAGTVDLGAIDRVDSRRPFATLLIPTDNDNAGQDTDPTATNLRLTDPVLDAFSILLSDGENIFSKFEGTGIDPATVNAASVVVRRNGRDLTEGEDFTLGFNASSGELRLTPVSNLWEPSSVYEIRLDNTFIADRAGNLLRPNRQNGTTRFTIILPTVQLDFGDAPASYGTNIVNDGARHAVIDEGDLRLGSRIDDEAESWRASGQFDDNRSNITFTSNAAPGTFSITTVGVGVESLGIDLLPLPGDILQVTELLGDQATFEFVLEGTAPSGDNIAVQFDPLGTTDELGVTLSDAIAKVFVDFGADVELDFQTSDSGAGTPATITLSKFDDEDGIGISQLQTAGAPGANPPLAANNHYVFVDPMVVSDETFTDPSQVSGYLNPADPRGTTIVINATSDGFVDAWVDFDGNGVFAASTETILDSVPVTAGENTFTIFTPDDATEGVTWARFRLSPEGNATPTGLVIGGEVEDYQVSIVNVDLPQPVNDSYIVDEDEVLDSSTLGSNPSVFGNDTFDAAQFMPITAVVVDGPSYGTLTLDPSTGEFVYDSVEDFAGIDTFTYRLYDQATGAASPVNDVMGNPIGYGTVTIDVQPVNDVPSVENLTLLALEDTQRTFTAEQLKDSAFGDESRDFTLTLPDGSTQSAPWDESIQTFNVIALHTTVGGVTTDITSSTTTPTQGFKTPRGRIIPNWDMTTGYLLDVNYLADTDLNQDNANGNSLLRDDFQFTIEDDGELINPGQDLVDSSDDTTSTGPKLTARATAEIDVKPKNDAPVAAEDVISENNADWNAFFIGPDPMNPVAPVPVPTEDQTLVIPQAYLIANDKEAGDSAADENDNTNDAGLTVTAVSATSALGGTVSIDSNGDIVYTPAQNTYGEDSFTYTVTDSGITFDLGPEGMPGSMMEEPDPLSHTATVRILIKPVNDTPQANDLSLDLLEYREDADVTGGANPDPKSDGVGFKNFSKDDLLRLGGSGSALEVTPPADFPADFDEDAQDLRVIKIGLPDPAGASVDARLLTYDAVTGLAPVQTLTTANGTLTLTFSLVADPMNPGMFIADSGEFVSGSYEPNVDYNEESPFDTTDLFTYFVEDFSEIPVPGAGNFPGESLDSVGHGSLTSEAATVTMTTHATNDTPEFPVFNTVTFAEDINDAGDAFNTVIYDIYGESVIASADPAVHNLPQAIFVSRDTAEDERGNDSGAAATQTLTYSYNPLYVPNGMFNSDPVLDEYGVLTLTPNADAYGYALYEVTMTDNGQSYDPNTGMLVDDFRSITRTLTIHITPVNDAPVTEDRALEVMEVEEFSSPDDMPTGAVASIDLTPEQFLGGTTENSELAEQSDFTDDMDAVDEFDEEEQNLRVVEFTVTLADGSTEVVNAENNNGVELTLATGRITFNFDDITAGGAYTGGTYFPNVDYNEESPFAPNEQFTYVVEDFGVTTIPGSLDVTGTTEQVDYTNDGGSPPVGLNNRSTPRTMTLTTRAQNDVPEFPIFGEVSFAEDINDAGDAFNTVFYDIYGEAVIASADPAVHNLPQAIFVSRATAEDERGNDSGALPTQNLSFSFATVYEPDGMFETTPTLDEYGVLTLTPRADAYGYAVFVVTLTDDGGSYNLPNDPRSINRTLTVHITPVNDAPVTFDRALEVDEVEEFASPDDSPTGDVASIDLTPAQFLGGTAENTELGEQSDFTDDVDAVDEFDEEEQSLRVVEFTVTLADGSTEVVNAENNNGVELTLATGRITFNFDDITAGGAYTGGTYFPNVDYNEESPFAPNEQFTYVVEDFGVTSIPGSQFINGGAADQVDYTNDGGSPPVGLNNRSTPRTMTLTTRAQNDAPEFPVFNTVTFAEDINDAGDAFNTVFYDIYGESVIASADPAVHNLPQAIFVSRDTAEDERGNSSGAPATQTLTYTYNPLYVPAGMFNSDPVLDEYGVLTLTPNADAYGYALYEVTMTDNGQSYDPNTGMLVDDFRSITRTLTIHITPVNDAPVTEDRALEVMEVEEFSSPDDLPTGAVASIDLTPEQFLGGTTENTELAEQSDFTDDIDAVDEFDEEEQSLRVVEFTVTLADGSTEVVNAESNNGVELTLATGRITFNFDDITAGGAYTGGIYFPNVDYNEESPFAPNEQFTYVVEDFGVTTIPGSLDVTGTTEQVDYTNDGGSPPVGLNNRSTPRTMTLTTRAQNDAPEFPVFNTVTFAEDINDTGDAFNTVFYDIYSGNVVASYDPANPMRPQAIFVSRDTALDERGDGLGFAPTQSLSYTFTSLASSSPVGMFETLPTLDDFGVLTLTPRADVYGWAVFEVTATDDGSSYDGAGGLVSDARSITRTLTINITPVNDQPVTFDRDLEVTENEEFSAPDDLPTGAVARLPLLPQDFLGGTTANPTLATASDFSDETVTFEEFDEDEQGLRVVEFQVRLANGDPLTVNATNYVNNTPITLVSGTVSFEFDPVTGAFIEGEYLPSVDVNDQLPFEPTEVFSYIVEDFAPTSIPGADRPEPDATGTIDYTTVAGVGSNNRSAPRDMTLTVRAINDVPEFPEFNTVTFAEDINDEGAAFNTVFYDIYAGQVISTNNPLAHGLPQAIHPSRATALDERSVQEVSFSVDVVSAPSGMFASDPILDRFGVLQLQPNADAYGYAVFTVTATDDGQSYINGLMQDSPRSVTRTLTVNITPVNDQPVAYDRELTVNEVEEFAPITGLPTGNVAVLNLTPETFLEGTPDAQTADFANGVVTTNEFDEDEQGLRVVQFTVTNASGTPTVVNRDNLNGMVIPLATGTVTFNFDASGAFTDGQYVPNVDYNQESPFDPFERFSYIVEDFGATSIPGTDYINGQMNPPVAGFQQSDYTTVGGVGSNNRSDSRRVTIRTIQVNDAPRIEYRETVDIRERDDNRGTSLTDWATRRDPAESTALDENTRQDVFFTFKEYVSQSVPDLFRPGFTPEVSDDGTLTVYPSPDAVGTGVFVMLATDRVSDTDPFSPKSVELTVTVNVRPVNDQPRLSDLAPTPLTGLADDQYEILADGTLVLTIKEDNTASDGTTGMPYSILLHSAGINSRPGLLDIYTPGPANEADGTLGGGQTVELVPFTTLPTTLGGSVTYIPENGGTPASLEYTPPTNINSLNNLPDSFTYQVIDDGTNFNIRDQQLDSSPLTRTGRIQFVLNPVNDRPQFDVAQTVINVSEDANMFVRNDFAFNIFGGPTPTASDEFSLTSAQTVTFNRIEPVNISSTQAGQAFSTLPTIVPAGHLTFQAAPGVFGEFVFDVYARDNGEGPALGRGDLNESLARRITINVTAVNDAPIPANGTGDTITISTREDSALNIPVDGAINGSLLGNFIAGPDSPVDGLPGENDTQVLSAINVPLQTMMGGTLTPTPNGAGATAYVYTPPLNFVGTDQFVYEVSDGDLSRTTPATISLVVTPVNDAPIVSPLAPIVVEESEGQVTLPDWLGTVLVGPPGTGAGGRAVDEFDGTNTAAAQTITEYRFAYVSGDTDLLQTSVGNPTGLEILANGSLQFTTSDENSGSATYQLIAVDSGPNDAANGDVRESAPVEFTLTVADVNDLPTFTAGPAVTVLEDSGAYSQPWASDISAGPGNEAGQTVAFLVQVPAENQDLFAVQPAIDENGVLTFTVADDAAGSTNVTVTLQDFDNGVFAGSSQPVILPITITETADLPVANDDSFTTTEDAVLFFSIDDLLANDSDPDLADSLNFVELDTTTALGATVTINQVTGEIAYSPLDADAIQALRPGETLTDTFQYGLQDDSALTDIVTANVTLTIQGRNDAPVVVNDRLFIESVGTTVLDQDRDPLANDSDIDGTLDRTSLTIVVEPQFGTLSDDNGVLTYLPGPDFAGVDNFTYTIADDLGQASAQATVELQGRPTADVIMGGTSVGRTGVIDISDSFTTAFALDLSTIQIITQPSNGTADVIDGMIHYTPNAGYTGDDFLVFTVADENGNRSAPTRLNLNTVSSRLQNPVSFSDVNRNGEVTALDALLIINRLNEVSGSSSAERIPVTDDDYGIGTNNGVDEQFYYDQSGDSFISSLDALRVINELNSQTQGFGEPIGTTSNLLASDNVTTGGLGASSSTASEGVSSGASKWIDNSDSGVEVDVLNLIASDQTQDEKEEDSNESQLDAALRDLF